MEGALQLSKDLKRFQASSVSRIKNDTSRCLAVVLLFWKEW